MPINCQARDSFSTEARQKYYMGCARIQWHLLFKPELEIKRTWKCLQNINFEVFGCQLPALVNMFPLANRNQVPVWKRQQRCIPQQLLLYLRPILHSTKQRLMGKCHRTLCEIWYKNKST